ncbi:hypothetical protein BH20ACT2_BH20ACT2_09740 [soil metagenome]
MIRCFPRRRRRGSAAALALRLVTGLVAVSLLVAGCSDGDSADGEDRTVLAPDDTSDPPGTVAGTDALPPSSFEELAARYDPLLASHGLRLTRGALIDRSGGGYEPSATGTHLALYVEPTGVYSADDYLDGITELAALFGPMLFSEHADLETYDICQEPPPADDDSTEPPPITQVDLTRAQSAAIDWGTATLDTVVAAAEAEPPGLRLILSDVLRATDRYRRALPG